MKQKNNYQLSTLFSEEDELNIKQETISNFSNGLIVRLSGTLGFSTVSLFDNTLFKIIELGFKFLILDCQEITNISSSGIGEFTVIMKRLKKQNGGMILINVPSLMLDILKLLGFEDYFQIKDSIEEAIFHFRPDLNSQSENIFPLLFRCPLCAKQLKASEPGRFRCSTCKGALDIDEYGQVYPV